MKRAMLILAALALLLGSVEQANAGMILVVGNASSTMQTQLTSLGYTSTVVAESSFGSVNFNGYSGIWIGTSSQNIQLASRQSDLLNFMNAGGNVLYESIAPFTTNSATELPFGNEVTVVNQSQGGYGDTVHITNTLSPINAGLTDVGMSNWGFSYHNSFTSIGSFVGLQDSGTAGNWVTIAKDVGLGHLVITGLDNDAHNMPQGVTFTGNVLGLQAGTSVSGVNAVPEPSSFALLGIGTATFAGYFVWRRRKSLVAA